MLPYLSAFVVSAPRLLGLGGVGGAAPLSGELRSPDTGRQAPLWRGKEAGSSDAAFFQLRKPLPHILAPP